MNAATTRPSAKDRLSSLWVLKGYKREWLRHDLIAGAALFSLLVPAGMAYAQAAGLPPVTGLYATVVPLLVYAAVGPSRIMVLGPDSALAPLIAAAIVPLAAGNSGKSVALAGLLALLVGAFMLAGSALKLGTITGLLSKPIRLGYLNGIALLVALSQLPAFLGIEADGDVWQKLGQVTTGVFGGDIN
ncbi:SulP family inorganic anion transporter, partial [Paenarthrobacter sp. CM16]|uniref:SulP family inorganic anion transporter n=1 Tax=Paenarthrobacter sp. CM16 TaxID=2738447 RepID=UPI00155551F4